MDSPGRSLFVGSTTEKTEGQSALSDPQSTHDVSRGGGGGGGGRARADLIRTLIHSFVGIGVRRFAEAEFPRRRSLMQPRQRATCRTYKSPSPINNARVSFLLPPPPPPIDPRPLLPREPLVIVFIIIDRGLHPRRKNGCASSSLASASGKLMYLDRRTQRGRRGAPISVGSIRRAAPTYD